MKFFNHVQIKVKDLKKAVNSKVLLWQPRIQTSCKQSKIYPDSLQRWTR